jgi:hypothetical protein
MNRPLMFQDPHYQMLLQFNGFISTFTSVVMPKIYRDYLMKGTTRVKYETAALVFMMIGLGAASQYLKDLMKYGEPSPYMSGFDYAQRAIYSSGVIGQTERIVELTPLSLYGGMNDGLMGIILGEAGPGARNISTVGKVLSGISEGDIEKTVSQGAKLVPGISVLTSTRQKLGEDVEDFVLNL